MPVSKQIAGLILAGGRGSRMGNVDKGLKLFQDVPMVAHVIARLAPQVGPLMISANRNIDAYQAFGLPVCRDRIPDFSGPLAGLQAGLMQCDAEYLVTAPCDSPFLPHDLVPQLYATLIAQDAELAIAATDEGGTVQPHPVFCLMKTSVLPQLDVFLQEGARKFEAWCRSLKSATVHFPDASAFRNINTVEELRRYSADSGQPET